jgi:hypothetical protein
MAHVIIVEPIKSKAENFGVLFLGMAIRGEMATGLSASIFLPILLWCRRQKGFPLLSLARLRTLIRALVLLC